jgi:hypothetical protein
MLHRKNRVIKNSVSICVKGFLRNVAKHCGMPEKRGNENSDIRGSKKAYKGGNFQQELEFGPLLSSYLSDYSRSHLMSANCWLKNYHTRCCCYFHHSHIDTRLCAVTFSAKHMVQDICAGAGV